MKEMVRLTEHSPVPFDRFRIPAAPYEKSDSGVKFARKIDSVRKSCMMRPVMGYFIATIAKRKQPGYS